MPSAAAIRLHVESALAQRVPGALTPAARAERPVAPTGIAAIDALLEGGLPQGAISEITGAASTGRTTLGLSFVAAQVADGRVCAWVDVSDALCPESAAASGVELRRLLWVRCGAPAAEPEVLAGAPIRQQDESAERVHVHLGGGSGHPRGEVRGMAEAVSVVLGTGTHTQSHAYGKLKPAAAYARDKSVGTPGVTNRKLWVEANTAKGPERQEQVPWDRLPPRRGASVLTRAGSIAEPVLSGDAVAARCAEALRKPRGLSAAMLAGSPATIPAAAAFRADRRGAESKPWDRLEQALRATDLLLQAGGFGAIVLDMGSLAPEVVTRVPLATWFRFRAAADRSRISLLLLTQHACAHSSAEVLLRTSSGRPEPGTVLSALPFSVELLRQRFQPAIGRYVGNVVEMRKGPQRVSAKAAQSWQARTTWAGGR